jgi:hypothetical protein
MTQGNKLFCQAITVKRLHYITTGFIILSLQGGYKLQVLDALQRPVLDLTPVTADSEFVKNDVT